MKKYLTIFCLACLASLAAWADIITVNTNTYSSTTLTSPTFYGGTNSVFTYYGFPTTNYGGFGGANISSVGISSQAELGKLPPVQTSFDLTGTNCELLLDPWDYLNNQWSMAWFTLSDGATTTAYTNVPNMGPGHSPYYVRVSFASNITHHLVLSVKGGFTGINVSAGNSIGKHALPKPNLLIVEGDSYTEGYNPTVNVYGYNSFWFDGWAWQLAHLISNTIPVPSGVSGTGFVSTGGGTSPTFGQRVVADVCTLYTNALASGKYNQIFITASGSINDLGADTNALYTAATNVYTIIKAACPAARVFFIGNWLGAGGESSPSSSDLANDSTLSRAASALSIPYFSPIQANLKNAGNYYVFYPPGNTDAVHPSAAGYAIMAQWLNTNLFNVFGTNWDSGNTNSSIGFIPTYALTVINGSGSASGFTNGQPVYIAASNIPGASFSGWSGQNIASPGLAQTTVTVYSNTTVTANLTYLTPGSSISVTNYGASGDAVALTVQTTANSPMVRVIGTNRFDSTAIGKVIEIFRNGPQIAWTGNPNYAGSPTNYTTYYQDTICLVTNVTNGTNLWGSIPQGRTASAYCIVGTNNAAAFQAAINAAETLISGTVTNMTINIPNGTYLIIGAKALNPNYAMTSIFDSDYAVSVSSGGITFLGQSTNAVLMGCGAGMEHVLNNASPYGSGSYDVIRGAMIQTVLPIAYSQHPLVFQNLTLDGGVTNGLTLDNTYYILSINNGDGWDGTHHAVADGNGAGQFNQLKVFTNCVFQHWRGENLISFTDAGGTNTFIDIANCTFFDGCATADNMYFGQHVHGCRFIQMGKLVEYDQMNTTLPSVFENNYWSNIVGNAISFNAAMSVTDLPPQYTYTIRNNTGYIGSGVSQVTLQPAQNINIISNIFNGGASGVNFTGAGAQGGIYCKNVVINANNFGTEQPLYFTFNGCFNIFITNNTGSGAQYFASGANLYSNVVFSGNTFLSGPPDSRGGLGQYFIDLPGNNFGILNGVGDKDWSGTASTNAISYALGRFHNITAANSRSLFVLDDTSQNLIPPGAVLQITNSSSVKLSIYRSTQSLLGNSLSPIDQLSPGENKAYIWNNAIWQLQSILPNAPIPVNGF